MIRKVLRRAVSGCLPQGMTDYPEKEKSNPKANWKNKRGSRRWRDIFAVLIVVVLLGFILKGAVGAFNFGAVKTPSWDGQAPVAVYLNTKPASFVVYNKSNRKLALFSLKDNLMIPTGNANQPLVGVGFVGSAAEADENMRLVAGYLGADIQNYVYFKDEVPIDDKAFEKLFGEFSSIGTPFAIITKGLGDVSKTSLKKSDLLALWWQIKGLSVSDLDYEDLGKFSEDLVVSDKSKVRGLDVELTRGELSKYFENTKLQRETRRVVIENNSGVKGAGTLAGQILTLAGFDVVNIESKEGENPKSEIFSKNKDGYAQSYLAKIFNCDITAPSGDGQSDDETITVVVGKDFAKKYL